jgi:hypothetical protein
MGNSLEWEEVREMLNLLFLASMIAALLAYVFYLLAPTEKVRDIIKIPRKIGAKFLDLWRK